MGKICGIDTGGTFTDCALLLDDQLVRVKVPSTPPNFERGFYHALEEAARRTGCTLEALVGDLDHLIHGTTVATNMMVERRGARAGMLSTRGFADLLHMMRGIGRVKGLPPDQMMRVSLTSKPVPLIPKRLIGEVTERMDYAGKIVVPLDEDDCRAAIQRLLDEGVESIAISFLWSFRNPEHELRARALVEEMAPDLYVNTASQLAPKWGEYERTATAAIDAYVGPGTRRYVRDLVERASELGFRNPVLIMQCSGGAVPAHDVPGNTVRTIGSGPTGGIIGAQFLGDVLGHRNIIATDVGGTSFDVGMMYEGKPVGASTSILSQYEYFMPSVAVESIGAGGGSIAEYDSISRSLRVGPRSAGAHPGPACYGRGGTEPTVTDAAVVLGYLNPQYFLGGELALDVQAARQAVATVADPLGMSLEEAASGIVRIAEFHMADLIRKTVIQRGYDPRDFVLFAYGGAGPVHVGTYGAELGVQKIIIPLGDASSLWSAFGAASANILHVFERSELLDAPFDSVRVMGIYDELESTAADWLTDVGVEECDRAFHRTAALRYKAQVHEVEVPVPGGELTEEALSELVDRFEAKYEALYGKGAGYREAGVEVSGLRVDAVGATESPTTTPAEETEDVPEGASQGLRPIFWPELGRTCESGVYRGELLAPGNVVHGPAVVELPDTTLVVHPRQWGRLDRYGNLELST